MLSIDLTEFERLAYGQEHEEAVRILLDILQTVESSRGHFSICGMQGELISDDEGLTRLAAAISTLFANRAVSLSPQGFTRLVSANRWISAIFSATAFRNTDHLLLALAGKDKQISGDNLSKLAVLYSQESQLDLPIDLLFAARPLAAISLALCLIGSRQMISPVAHQKREAVLAWLPAKLDQLSSLDGLPLPMLNSAAMNCSYADLPQKHDIKRALNALVRRDLLSRGPIDLSAPASGKPRPTMLVVLDWWHPGHAMYRCYAPLIHACKSRFRLVALVTSPPATTTEALSLFDEKIEFDDHCQVWLAELRRVMPLIAEHAPDVVYFPSVGMSLATLYFSNIRMAPLQIAGMGHPATTGATCIDYVVSSPEVHGDDSTMFEPVCMMPRNCLGFLLPPGTTRPKRRRAVGTRNVRIAITASTMKLNPTLLTTLMEIATQATHKLSYVFFIGTCPGLTYLNAQRSIREVIPDCVTYPEQPYADYLAKLVDCDMFLSPFPFGNTNGIVDCFLLGIPGICLHGDQPHAAIDRGLFEMMELPGDLVAMSREGYVAAAVALADDPARRIGLRTQLLETDVEKRISAGRPEGLVETVVSLMAD